MIIELIRHGATELSECRCYQGRLDTPLSEAGRNRLTASEDKHNIIYITDKTRTAETADILFPEAEQRVVSELREMDFGDFEGRNYRDMENDADYRAWVEGGCWGRCPNGENRAEFSTRVCGAFSALVEKALAEGREELLIVAHGGTQMAVMATFVDPSKPFYTWLLDCGSGYILDTAHWQAERRLAWEDGVVDCVWRDSIPLYDRP